MSNGETNTHAARVVGAYRAASAALDERPHPETRAAILAAAAREAGAQPRDAATGATAPRRGPQASTRRIAPSRRPLALVASFLVATVAIVLATQTRDEGEMVGARSAAEAPASAAAPQAMQQEPSPEAKREIAAVASTETNAPRGAPARTASRVAPAASPPAMPAAPSAAPPPPTVAMRAAKPDAQADATRRAKELRAPPEQPMRADAGNAAIAEDRSVAPMDKVAAATPATPAAGGALAQSQPLARDERRNEAEDGARQRLAKARPVERTAAMAVDPVEDDPARWMERVIAFRDAGRDDDADRELKRLRERYPDFKVPPAALRHAATR